MINFDVPLFAYISSIFHSIVSLNERLTSHLHRISTEMEKRRRTEALPSFAEPPKAFLFYFPIDASYSVVGLQHRCWPPTTTLGTKISMTPMDKINLRIGDTLVEAILLAKGKLTAL